MEVNAPEKIYVQSFNVSEEDVKFARKLYFDDVWTEEPESGQENIEYTRTDAFIEKALDYIENNIYDHYDGDHEYGICGGYVKKEEFINNFKDHMKGE